MSMKISPPGFKGKSYERFKQELLAWNEITDITKKRRGIAIALSLPEEGANGIREKVFDELDLEVLNAENGLEKLIEFFDKTLGKDDLVDILEKFEEFEDYERECDQSVNDFISKFDQKYNKILKNKIVIPSEILAFKLLKRDDISKSEKMLVLLH